MSNKDKHPNLTLRR